MNTQNISDDKTKSDNKKALKYLGYFLLTIIAIGVWYISLPVLAIWYIWKKTDKSRTVKIAVTVVMVVLMLVGIAKVPPTPKSAIQQQTNNIQIEKPVVNNVTTKTEATPKPAEQMNIVVESQIVKKVDGKNRYFFDIRNKDKKAFSGKVSISLYNDKQPTPLGTGNFETSAPIEPGLGNFVNIDINTAPKAIHGEYGITSFKYEVSIDGNVVKSGEDGVSDKYEELSL